MYLKRYLIFIHVLIIIHTHYYKYLLLYCNDVTVRKYFYYIHHGFLSN
jgi:hypothetical protein